MTDRTHEWRQLGANQPISSPARATIPEHYQELVRRMDNLEAAHAAHDIVLCDHDDVHSHLQLAIDGQVDHFHPELVAKVGEVHEAITAMVKRSLQNRDTAEKLARDELKAAFGELANRLETVKQSGGALSRDVTEHHDELAKLKAGIEALDSQVNTLCTDIHLIEDHVMDTPAPVPAEPIKQTPWLTYLAIFLALVALSLQLFPLID